MQFGSLPGSSQRFAALATKLDHLQFSMKQLPIPFVRASPKGQDADKFWPCAGTDECFLAISRHLLVPGSWLPADG